MKKAQIAAMGVVSRSSRLRYDLSLRNKPALPTYSVSSTGVASVVGVASLSVLGGKNVWGWCPLSGSQ